MTHQQHTLSTILARYHFDRAPQAQYHIAPALTTGWPVIEFSQQAAEFCLVRELLLHADGRQSVEYSEFLLAKSLVHVIALRMLTGVAEAFIFVGVAITSHF